MLKQFLISVLMLFRFGELISKGIVFYDFDYETNNNSGQFKQIKNLHSDCLNIKQEIISLVKLTTIFESDSSNELNNSLKQVDCFTDLQENINSLSKFYTKFDKLKSLIEQFDVKFKQLKNLSQVIREKDSFRLNELSQQCNIYEHFEDSHFKPLNITKNNRCYLIEFYKDLIMNISANKWNQMNLEQHNVKQNLPTIQNRLLKYNRNIWQAAKTKQSQTKKSQKQCILKVYYKETMLEISKSIKANKKVLKLKLLKKCSLKLYYKNLLINVTKTKIRVLKVYKYLSNNITNSLRVKDINEQVKAMNQCHLIAHYQNLLTTQIARVKPVQPIIILNKCYLIDYYKLLFINTKVKAKLKIKRTVLSNQCHLIFHFKSLLIFSTKKQIKLKQQSLNKKIYMNTKCYSKDYYKELMFSSIQSTKMNVTSLKQNKNLLKITKSEAKSYLEIFYQDLIFNVISSVNNKRVNSSQQVKIVKLSRKFQLKNCYLNEYYIEITSIRAKTVKLIPKAESNHRSKIVKVSKYKKLNYYKRLLIYASYFNVKKSVQTKAKFQIKKINTNKCYLYKYYQELPTQISKETLKQLLNKPKYLKTCDLNDLLYFTFLKWDKTKTKQIKHISTSRSYSEYAFLFSAKYLYCSINKAFKPILNSPLEIKITIKIECKECISYKDWFIQLAQLRLNKTKNIKLNCNETKANVQIAPIEVQFEKTIKKEIQIVKKPIEVVHCDNKVQIDCYDYYKQGYLKNTILTVRPNLKPDCDKVKVSCDMKSGGFTLISRRQYSTNSFKRDWNDYKNGFGEPSKDHWIGNDMIYYLTNQLNYSLRIEMEDWEGNKKFANYDLFRVKSEEEGYELDVSGYHGDAGDSFSNHSGTKFSTYDVDNDDAPEWFWDGNCAERFGGGWWYKACYKSNLNGKYYLNGKVPLNDDGIALNDGIAWNSWRPANYSLKMVEMKIRRNFQKRL